MNIALIGYGKMGKEIEAIAKEKNITIAKVFSSENNIGGKALTNDSLHNIDVCIEFTRPEQAFENLSAAIKAKKNIVCGTTGWLNRMDEIKNLAKENNVGFLYASNFSIGMNIFFELVSQAGMLFNSFNDYDGFIHETHHVDKPDSPSGTALHIASLLLQNFTRKKEIVHETAHTPLKSNQLHVTSTRAGHWIGQHNVTFDSEADTIELIHTARSRRGFALGALVAAQWLHNKKGIYSMKDILL